MQSCCALLIWTNGLQFKMANQFVWIWDGALISSTNWFLSKNPMTQAHRCILSWIWIPTCTDSFSVLKKTNKACLPSTVLSVAAAGEPGLHGVSVPWDGVPLAKDVISMGSRRSRAPLQYLVLTVIQWVRTSVPLLRTLCFIDLKMC